MNGKTNGNGKTSVKHRRGDYKSYTEAMYRSCAIYHLTGFLNTIAMMRDYGAHISNGCEAMIRQEIRQNQQLLALARIKEKGKLARAPHKGRVVQLARHSAMRKAA
jgi:hypothetical protein